MRQLIQVLEETAGSAPGAYLQEPSQVTFDPPMNKKQNHVY